MNWHYTIGGQTYGPISEAELDGLVQAGTIGLDTLVWREGMANWEPYSAAKPGVSPSAGGLRMAGAPQSSAAAAAIGQEQAACSECGTVLPRANLVQIGSSLICAQCKPRYVQKLREGVEMQQGAAMNYAGFWIRVGAHIIDAIIMQVINVVLGLAFGISAASIARGGNAASITATGMFWLVSVSVALAYDVGCVGTWGATPGKMACGLRIVTAEGYKVSYLRAFGRYFAKILSALACGIGFLMVAFDDQKQGLHDRICNTRVVKR
jgi:uncharacterized RDD family membrane protein YckC